MRVSKLHDPNERQFDWHDWFAWYPLYINNDDVRALVFWETVQRRRIMSSGRTFCWEYRIPG